MNLNALQKQEVNEVLSSFGLKEKERLIYIATLKSGRTTITPLAAQTGIPPTTVESVLERLYKDGLVSISKHRSRRTYEALEPETLKNILERKLREVKTIIPFLESLQKEGGTTTKVTIFYRERFNDIFDRSLAGKERCIYEIVSAKDFQEILGEKYHFTKQRLAHKVSLKSLRVESQEIKKYNRERNMRELREARFLPRTTTFEGTIMFWDASVAIFTNKSEGVAVVIESPSLAVTFRQLFGILWEISRPIT